MSKEIMIRYWMEKAYEDLASARSNFLSDRSFFDFKEMNRMELREKCRCFRLPGPELIRSWQIGSFNRFILGKYAQDSDDSGRFTFHLEFRFITHG